MRINKIVIANFKNFIGNHIFALDKDINILYGDNGFGKSSFFDAIEWCLTGTINRYKNLGNEDFTEEDIINHYVNLNEFSCSVSIEYSDYILVRSFNVLNGKKNSNVVVKIDHKDKKISSIKGQLNVEQFMKNSLAKKENIQKGMFQQMLKQTYILSQDQIADFIINEKPEERYRAIANIMGLQSGINLSTNIRKIRSEINSQYEKLERKKAELYEQINSKNELKIYININQLTENIKKADPNFGGVLQEFDSQNYSSKYIIIKDNMENALKICDLLLENRIPNLQILKSEIKQIKAKIDDNNNKCSILYKNKEDIVNKTKEINSLRLDVKKFEDLRTSILEKESYLNKFNIKQDISILKQDIENKRDTINKVQYIVSIYKTYNNAKLEVSKLPQQIIDIENIIKSSEEKMLHIKNELDILNVHIQNSQGALINQLVSNIKNIKEYVVEIGTEGICPVCSSIIGEKLPDIIDERINYFNSQYDEKNKYINELNNKKLKLESNYKSVSELINNKNNEMKQLKLKISSAKKQIENISNNNLFDEKLINSYNCDLEKKLNEENNGLTILENALSLVIELNSLKKKNSSIVYSEKNDSVPINELSIEIEKLREKGASIEKNIDSIKFENTKLEKQCKELEIFVYEIKKNDYLNNTNEDFIDIKSRIIQEIQDCVNITELNKDINIKIQQYKSNQLIESQINDIENNIKNVDLKIEKLSKIIAGIGALVGNVYEIFGEQAKTYLNNKNSPIKKYFRYLNPSPYINNLHFEGKDEELSIYVQCNTKNKILKLASKTLSSGQLNVLAISIFIAINESQKINDLDFLAIDDPIQNMDDVNQFSICDILSSINKQLIFSTHDIGFVKLFIKKNEHRKDSIQVINFKSPYLEEKAVERIRFDEKYDISK